MKIFRLLLAIVLLLPLPSAFAATDGTYQLFQIQTSWDGTQANRLTAQTSDYTYTYGDEGSVTYNLPWPFTFYGHVYSQITADTNGNIWFGATGSAHSFNLQNTGRGPVIAAWNNDLSSAFYGGVFVQHKTSPERVVVEWRAETYTDEGSHRPNRFEAVIYQNGSIRLDYGTFTLSTLKDFGSGISTGNGTSHLSLSTSFGSPYNLVGRSYGYGLASVPAVAVDQPNPTTPSSTWRLSGVMQVGSTIAVNAPAGVTVGPISYDSPTTWSCTLTNLPTGSTPVTITATSPTGQVSPLSTNITYSPVAAPVPGMTLPAALATLLGLVLVMRFGGRRVSAVDQS